MPCWAVARAIFCHFFTCTHALHTHLSVSSSLPCSAGQRVTLLGCGLLDRVPEAKSAAGGMAQAWLQGHCGGDILRLLGTFGVQQNQGGWGLVPPCAAEQPCTWGKALRLWGDVLVQACCVFVASSCLDAVLG